LLKPGLWKTPPAIFAPALHPGADFLREIAVRENFSRAKLLVEKLCIACGAPRFAS